MKEITIDTQRSSMKELESMLHTFQDFEDCKNKYEALKTELCYAEKADIEAKLRCKRLFICITIILFVLYLFEFIYLVKNAIKPLLTILGISFIVMFTFASMTAILLYFRKYEMIVVNAKNNRQTCEDEFLETRGKLRGIAEEIDNIREKLPATENFVATPFSVYAMYEMIKNGFCASLIEAKRGYITRVENCISQNNPDYKQVIEKNEEFENRLKWVKEELKTAKYE